MTAAEFELGPCGEPAQVPLVAVRTVITDAGPRVEIALTSDPYGWRVRSWWTPGMARQIAADLLAAADGGGS